MELFKIIVIAVAGVVMIVLVKQYRPEYAALIRIAAGLVIFFLIAGQLSGIVSGIEGLISLCGYNRDYARVLMKALGICISVQLGADTCRDAGESALATKIELAGKAAVIAVSMPLFETAVKIIGSIVGG